MTAILLYQPESAAQPAKYANRSLFFLDGHCIGIDHRFLARSHFCNLQSAPSQADPQSRRLADIWPDGGALAERGSPFGDREFSEARRIPGGSSENHMKCGINLLLSISQTRVGGRLCHPTKFANVGMPTMVAIQHAPTICLYFPSPVVIQMQLELEYSCSEKPADTGRVQRLSCPLAA